MTTWAWEPPGLDGRLVTLTQYARSIGNGVAVAPFDVHIRGSERAARWEKSDHDLNLGL
jgi:ribosome maturation factor RimP